MDFLTNIFLALILWLHPLPLAPTIIHHPIPAPKEFTIETVNIAPSVPKPALKPAPKLGGIEESLFAHITNGVVDNVIVISQENIDTGKWGDPKDWVQTSMNGSLRKNYAGHGYSYDKTHDVFIPPRGSGSVFNEQKAQWEQTPEEIETMRMIMENQKQIKAISQ